MADALSPLCVRVPDDGSGTPVQDEHQGSEEEDEDALSERGHHSEVSQLGCLQAI